MRKVDIRQLKIVWLPEGTSIGTTYDTDKIIIKLYSKSLYSPKLNYETTVPSGKMWKLEIFCEKIK